VAGSTGVDEVVQALIRRFGLQPLPIEGTLYTATYRSETESAAGQPVGTAMIGLYAHHPLSRSTFHRLQHDEVWHHYGGDPLRLVLLHPDGSAEDRWLGSATSGHEPQTVITAGTWQAGEVDPNGVWALFGCTVAPGFTPECFEAGDPAELLRSYPDRELDIVRLTERIDPNTSSPAAMPTLPAARTPHEARERSALLRQLAAQRRHIIGAARSLSPQQLMGRPLPSGWNAASLLQHLTLDVERWWFRRVLLGEQVDVGGPLGDAWQGAEASAVIDGYEHEIELIDRIIETRSLDETLAWWPTDLMGPQFMHTLRDLVLHVITETATHAGHLDVLRESLTGDQWLVLE
jgi:predicted cupin superfamily sugar epimerase/uncharacterized damage-inducible protein DinB